MLPGEVFLDASYVIALSSPVDMNHARAAELARQLEQTDNVHLVTTRAVLLEIGNALARQRFRSAAIELLEAIENDPAIEIVALSETLFARAFRLFRDRQDKEWGLTDCVSFVVMQERGITAALTADTHYRQAGFQPLLSSAAES